jgi:predicted metal-dependent phosphoesterase TrpH
LPVIDLHCHTDCSDGSVDPLVLLNDAIGLGLKALAITDHDTLDGYDLALPRAREAGFDLVCAVELSTHWQGSVRSAHLLGYFAEDPGEDFRGWLQSLRDGRRERNVILLRRLHELGMDISWDELQAIGKRQIGRPHFAKLMVDKGYAGSVREAFDRYLSETGLAWVDRDEPALGEAIERVAAAGGVASLAHPVRISRDPALLRELAATLLPHGLEALECFHSEHTAADTDQLLEIAAELGLEVTGGSDFHGSYKPETLLGSGREGNVDIPVWVLEKLKRRFLDKAGRQRHPSRSAGSDAAIFEARRER